jgi:hypothetical protein
MRRRCGISSASYATENDSNAHRKPSESVPAAEYNPIGRIKTNVIGAENGGAPDTSIA